jgi:hypothetical protein
MKTDHDGNPLSTQEIIRLREQDRARWQFVGWIAASCLLVFVASLFGITL